MFPSKNDRERILIVDDDESIRSGLKESLESKGFKIYLASDGLEAGVLAAKREPALIILDIKMQGLDGFNACRLIRSNPLLKNIKILALTGHPSKVNVTRILRFGADRCLAKPVSGKNLLRAIDRLLDLRKEQNA